MKPKSLEKLPFTQGCVILVACLTSLSLKPVYSSPIKLSTQIAQQTPSIGREVRSFFETGRLTSEDRLLFQSPPNDIIPVREQSNSWQFIIFKAGGVSFWMPPGILTEEVISLDTQLGEISFRTLTANTEEKRYITAYASRLTEEQIENPDLLLQAIQDRVTLENEFNLTRQRSVSLDEYPGKELTFENEQEIITFRVYLVDDRLYALGVRSPKSTDDSRSTRAFLNALELLPN